MYKMFGRRFSQSERRLSIEEILKGLTYNTEAQVNANVSGKGNPYFDALPKPIEKSKLDEALKQFEVGNQGSPTTPP
jgi:hypothetical protein